MSEPPRHDSWENGEDWKPPAQPVQLVLDLDGYEGPLDLLLGLAREQKVDLRQISILQLAEQYLAYIADARRRRLELAADYLVMAAWLAYLKSRLLLPEQEEETDEPSAEELARLLAIRLRRLEAMREAGRRLMGRPRLGLDIFARPDPEGIKGDASAIYELSLYELLAAYGRQRARAETPVLTISATRLMSVEAARTRLQRLLGVSLPGWQTLSAYLPAEMGEGLVGRSQLASTFVASLELAKEGLLEIRQNDLFGAIYLRRAGETS